MNNQLKTQVLNELQSAKNVLVTVSRNPTVDELSASIALTLLLNKLDKHATTVFSGVVPSTIEFLQPEKTIESTTDSLRDFIIALDKSKADKLRYKVEDDVVRIFITPYKTSITEHDLEYSQGDFNVDVVMALGVAKREDLDQAITAHGRILHDATVIALTNRSTVSELGSMNWAEPQSSSLCEMVAALVYDLGAQSIDGQMATALLTGIIAETDRFKNEKTTPLSLSLSSQLMIAGANQQLIADKLEEPLPAPLAEQPITEPIITEDPETKPLAILQHDGELDINHDEASGDPAETDEDSIEKIHIDEHGNLSPLDILNQANQKDNPSSENVYTQPDTAEQESNSGDITNQEDQNVGNEPPVDPEGNEFQEEVSKTLYEDAPQDITESDDSQDKPAVAQPNNDIPTMTHGRVIQPPTHEGDKFKSDKPFDLNQALQDELAKEENRNEQQNNSPQVQDLPDSVPSTLPAPRISEATESSSDVMPETAASVEPVEPPSQPPTQTVEPTYTQPITPGPQQSSTTAPSTPQISEPTSAPPIPIHNESSQDSQDQSPQSLQDLEKAVDSPHVKDLDSMRDIVAKAADSQPPAFPAPHESNGAGIVDLNVQNSQQSEPEPDPNAAPPVPPPMMAPQFYDSDGKKSTLFDA